MNRHFTKENLQRHEKARERMLNIIILMGQTEPTILPTCQLESVLQGRTDLTFTTAAVDGAIRTLIHCWWENNTANRK